MRIELKPCPFCGGEASVYDWQSVVGIGCSDEDCPGSMLSEWCFSTTYDAAETWNTRAERTCKLPETRIDHGSIEYNGTTEWRRCSECGAEVLAYPARFCPNCGAKVVE